MNTFFGIIFGIMYFIWQAYTTQIRIWNVSRATEGSLVPLLSPHPHPQATLCWMKSILMYQWHPQQHFSTKPSSVCLPQMVSKSLICPTFWNLLESSGINSCAFAVSLSPLYSMTWQQRAQLLLPCVLSLNQVETKHQTVICQQVAFCTPVAPVMLNLLCIFWIFASPKNQEWDWQRQTSV